MPKNDDKQSDERYNFYKKKTKYISNVFFIQGFQLRDKDFRSIFSELPSDEQLIIGI